MTSEELDTDIKNAVEILKDGGLILYPTDTIWGLGCDATNGKALERLFDLKRRPSSKSMISLIDSLTSLAEWVEIIPEEAVEVFRYSTTPTTVILDSPVGLSPMLIAEDGTAAFRIPMLKYTKEICKLLGRPLVSTSANLSGTQFSGKFTDITDILKEGVDYVCRYGRDSSNQIPSRILKIDSDGTTKRIR